MKRHGFEDEAEEVGSACIDTIVGLQLRQDWRIRALLFVGRPLVGAIFQACFRRMHQRGLVSTYTLHQLEPLAERILWPKPKTRPSRYGRGIGTKKKPNK